MTDPSACFFRYLSDSSNDITVVMAASGQLHYVSPAVVSVLGCIQQPVASSLPEILHWVHPEERLVLAELFQESVDLPQYLMARLRHQMGHWVNCSLLIQEIPAANFLELGLDLSEAHWYQISIRPLFNADLSALAFGAEELQAQSQTKSHFLAIMSHELRTPINAINGFSQLLLHQRRNPLSPEQSDMVQRILTNGKNLLALINNILDLSKLEAGRMNLQVEPLNVSTLTHNVVRELASLATQNNLRLELVDYLTNAMIVNDPLRLRQIIVNLLSNAIKFTTEGTVWVVIESCETSKIRLSVQDSGAGIAQDDLEQVFSEFWQADSHPDARYHGTGLGLAISHNLAKMMKGEIQVHSQLGQGATFRLIIPREVTSRSPQAYDL